jgi:hypothetical protein
MIEDAAARGLLDEVVTEWTEAGVLGELCSIVRTVWRQNVDRHEPRLGDDALSLGVQASRNVCNLAVRNLGKTPDVRARDAQTLEVFHQGRILHTSKVGSRSSTWDVSSADWSSSDVRTNSAQANAKAYMPVDGTLFERVGALPGQMADPRVLRYLHLLWQGFDNGGTRSWIGFPCVTAPFWFAVVLLDDNLRGTGGIDLDSSNPLSSTSDFDTLAPPDVVVRRTTGEQRQMPPGA